MGAQEKLVHYFKDADLEYENINADLRRWLAEGVYEEVIAFIALKTEEAMDKAWKQLYFRFEKLHELDNRLPEEPSQEEVQDYIKEFLSLTDPAKISNELQLFLGFNGLEKEYLDFIEKMSLQEWGGIFKRYVYPSQFYDGLRNGILIHIEQLVSSLHEYTKKIGEYALALENARQDQRGKAFIKGGASLLGMMVGIPFAGAGVGALLGGDDRSKVNDSLKKIFVGWENYEKQFLTFFKSLESNYRLAIATLYGGTLLRVNEQLKSNRLMIGDLAMLGTEYILVLTPEEEEDTREWVEGQISGIETLIKRERWTDAIQVAGKLLSAIRNRPAAGRTIVYDGKSAEYLSHLYYYVSYQEALLEEHKNGHIESFLERTNTLFSQLYILLEERMLEKEFSHPAKLYFRYIKESLKAGKVENLRSLRDFLARVESRMGRDGMYPGENFFVIEEVREEYAAILISEAFLGTLPAFKELGDGEDEVKFKPVQLKRLISIDRKIGSRDGFSAFLKRKYWKTVLLPWQNPSFAWLGKQKKKIAAGLLCLFMIIGGVYAGEKSWELMKDRSAAWTEDKEPVAADNPVYLHITTDYANVRSDASLHSQIVETVSPSAEMQFLNEKSVDSEGRTWLLIRLEDGREGWISGKVVEE